MRIKWLRNALKNLDDSASYIAKESSVAARALVKTVQDTVEHLAQFPGLGRPGRVPGTRELVLQDFPYIIPYRVRNDTVEILRVFHAAQQLPLAW